MQLYRDLCELYTHVLPPCVQHVKDADKVTELCYADCRQKHYHIDIVVVAYVCGWAENSAPQNSGGQINVDKSC